MARLFSENFLIDLKTNLSEFELSTTLRSRDRTALTSPWKGFFPKEILPELPISNSISKIYFMFLIMNKCFATELLSEQSKGYVL